MDFKNSFSAGKRTKFPTKATYYFPSHLQYVVALPCKSYKFEFWHIWKKMQTKIKCNMH